MDSTVRIEGVEYAPCEILQSGEYCGIKTPEKTFWVYPVCDDEGREIKSLPPFLPREIRAVTVKSPDLTQRYPETVKEFFDKRRSYFNAATLQTYVNQYPNENRLTEEQFQTARREILNEPMEEFAQDSRTRQMVWDRHGTVALANEMGYMGDVWETEVLADGTLRRFSPKASVAMSLAFRLQAKSNLGWKQVWEIVGKLKYVVIYEDAPERKFIYLRGMKVAAVSAQGTSDAPEMEVEAKTESKTRDKVDLHWPDGEKYLKQIKSTTKQTLTKVTQIQGRKQAKEKKWHQEGGKATSKWTGHELEAAELARHMRQVRDSWIRTNGTKRGARKKAIESGHAWWRKRFAGTPLEAFLDESKVSDANLDRLMGKDFRKNHASET